MPKKLLKLAVPREAAEEKLDNQIEKAEELLSRQINTEAQMETLRDESASWSDDNRHLLKDLFTTDELSQEYGYDFFVDTNREPPLQERVANTKSDIERRVRQLKGVRDRLELIPHDG